MIVAARLCHPRYSFARLSSHLCRKVAGPNTLAGNMAAMSTSASKHVALLLGDTFPDFEAETTQVQRSYYLFCCSGRGEVAVPFFIDAEGYVS